MATEADLQGGDQALHRLAGWYAIALRLGGAVLFTAVVVTFRARRRAFHGGAGCES